MSKRLTLEEFIRRTEEVHGKSRYDFTNTKYVNNRTHVLVKCNLCGKELSVYPSSFSVSKNSGCDCQPKEKSPVHDIKSFIKEAEKLYGKDKYDFSDSKYLGMKKPIKIFCNNCKSYFWKTPYSFLHGSECGCYRKITTETFIERAEDIYGVGRYGYQESVYVNNKTPVKIFCPECNKYFYKTPHAFIDGNLGCPGCFHNLHESKGESIVKKVLEELNFEFDQEYYMGGCIQGRNTKSLRIDFRLQTTTKEIWIEYNGKQHYIENDYFNKDDPDWFKKQLIRDKNVREYCEKNNILLIEIPYTYITLDKIRTVLSDILINHKSPEEIITYPEIIPLDNKT